MKMPERRCENWLKSFGEWTLPRSEAPESFIFWTGLFTLASAVRRQIYVPKEMMGSYEVSPNLYIMFIAPPGKARKSTTTNYSEDLLDEIPDITKSPELITKEALLSTIVKSKDRSMSIHAPEFGEFIVKSGPEMYSFLTNGYDGKKRLGSSTLSRSLETVDRPCINLLGATTPVWVAENMPESVIGGGYASRVIFIYEDKVRRRQLFYNQRAGQVINTVDPVKMAQLREDLIADLTYIALNLHGAFTITEEAQIFMDGQDGKGGWYRDTSDSHSDDNYKLHGYYERKPVHVLKLAMLLHIARSDELVLDVEDFTAAIALLEQIEKRLPDTFQAVGKNPFNVDIKRIFGYIKQKGQVSELDLKRQFQHVALPIQLDELIRSLLEANYVVMKLDTTKTGLAARIYSISAAF